MKGYKKSRSCMYKQKVIFYKTIKALRQCNRKGLILGVYGNLFLTEQTCGIRQLTSVLGLVVLVKYQ
jgi:hypothetical protein